MTMRDSEGSSSSTSSALNTVPKPPVAIFLPSRTLSCIVNHNAQPSNKLTLLLTCLMKMRESLHAWGEASVGGWAQHLCVHLAVGQALKLIKDVIIHRALQDACSVPSGLKKPCMLACACMLLGRLLHMLHMLHLAHVPYCAAYLAWQIDRPGWH